MRDLMGMLGKAKELQAKMQEAQDEIAAMRIEGSSGGGLVKVTLTGKGDMASVRIDPSLIKPEDAEILEDLIVAAHNDARAKIDGAVQQKMAAITGGLGLPPGLKLPF